MIKFWSKTLHMIYVIDCIKLRLFDNVKIRSELSQNSNQRIIHGDSMVSKEVIGILLYFIKNRISEYNHSIHLLVIKFIW